MANNYVITVFLCQRENNNYGMYSHRHESGCDKSVFFFAMAYLYCFYFYVMVKVKDNENCYKTVSFV